MRPTNPLTLVLIFSILFLQGCGYGFRANSNVWSKDGVETIYVAPLENNTIRSGVEVAFTSALIKEFSKGKRIRLVNSEKDADAILSGSVQTVESRYFSTTTANQVSQYLPQDQVLSPSYVIATEYRATAQISVDLKRRKDGRVLWSQGFSKSRIYPASNYGGDIGNTSVLINESLFDMALKEISVSLAAEVHDLFFESF